MWNKILEWIRGVFKMLNLAGVKQAFGIEPALSQNMQNAIAQWAAMYENRAEWLNADIRSLGVPSAIAAEVSRAVTIEMEMELSGGARANYLTEQMNPVLKEIRKNTEYALAKGGMIFKPYMQNGNLIVDYIQADQFYPVEFDGNGKITACVFVYQIQRGETYYTRLEFHRLTETELTIINTAYSSKSKETLGTKISLTNVPEWADLEPEAQLSGIVKPLWGHFKPPLANNIDVTSPLGVSVYSRAVDLIKRADEIYSNFLWEVESGKRALYVERTAFGKDENGKDKIPDRRLYRLIDLQASIDKPGLFQDWSPTIRQADLLASLDAQLKRIEFSCGLAQGTISDPNTVALTATEIKMSKQRTYALIVDTQKALEDALNDLLYAMDVWATILSLAPRSAYSSMWHWDDSVVSDHEAQFLQDSQAVGLAVMPKSVFLERNYKLDEATAAAWLARVSAENAQVTEFFPNEE